MSTRRRYPSDHRPYFRVLESILDDERLNALPLEDQAIFFRLLAMLNRVGSRDGSAFLPWRAVNLVTARYRRAYSEPAIRRLGDGGLLAVRCRVAGVEVAVPNWPTIQGFSPAELRRGSDGPKKGKIEGLARASSEPAPSRLGAGDHEAPSNYAKNKEVAPALRGEENYDSKKEKSDLESEPAGSESALNGSNPALYEPESNGRDAVGSAETNDRPVPGAVHRGRARSSRREPVPVPPEAAKFASDFRAALAREHPGWKAPTDASFAKWETSARLLLAERAEPEVRRLARWLFDPSPSEGAAFWRSVVLSVPKFRERFDQLAARKRQEESHGRPQLSAATDLATAAREHLARRRSQPTV